MVAPPRLAKNHPLRYQHTKHHQRQRNQRYKDQHNGDRVIERCPATWRATRSRALVRRHFGAIAAPMLGVGMLSVGMLSVGMLGVGMLGVGMLGVGMLGVGSRGMDSGASRDGADSGCRWLAGSAVSIDRVHRIEVGGVGGGERRRIYGEQRLIVRLGVFREVIAPREHQAIINDDHLVMHEVLLATRRKAMRWGRDEPWIAEEPETLIACGGVRVVAGVAMWVGEPQNILHAVGIVDATDIEGMIGCEWRKRRQNALVTNQEGEDADTPGLVDRFDQRLLDAL